MSFNPLFAALAVLDTAPLSLLNQLAESNFHQEDAAAILAGTVTVAPDGRVTADPAAAAACLKALEAEDFLHFRRLHERALHLLTAQLEAGNLSVEPSFRAVFVRLADRLTNQAPQELANLIEAIRTVAAPQTSRDYMLLFEGIAWRNLERSGEAAARFDELLRRPDLDLDIRGRALMARGIGQLWQGHMQAALDSYAASLAIWQQAGDAVQEALARLNIGIVAYELHDYGRAEAELLHAGQLLRAAQVITWMPTVWNELGLVYRDQGRWQEALENFERARAQRQAEGSMHRAGVMLNNIGEVLLLQGQIEDAEAAFHEALAKLTVHNVRIDTFVNLGLLLQMRGDLNGAEQQYTAALQLAQAIDRRDIWPTIHYRLADVLRHTQTPPAALAHLVQGIELIEARRTPLRDEGLRISLLGRAQQLYELAVLLLIDEGRGAEAFATVERARARAFLDLLGEDMPDGLGGMPETPPATAAAVQASLSAGMAIVEFFATGTPGSYRDVVMNLPPQAQGLRELLLPPERLFAFVVTRTELHVVELAASLAGIEREHFNRSDGRLRGITALPGQPLRPMKRWRDLGARLLLPLQRYARGVRHLTFVPYGPLHYLPLHALAALQDLTGIRNTTVGYAPSASILIRQTTHTERQRPPSTLLAIGVNGLGLEHAEAEAAWIASQYGGAALLGSAARPGAVLEALGNFDVIHFSCHGHFRRRSPMHSALALAEGELTAADILHAVEARGTRMRADIVTLSACDTGLNHVAPSDELLGLTRAFLGCGTRSLVVTLWPVHEVPTRLFMEHFYQTWRKGASKTEALAAAQQYLTAVDFAALETRLRDYALSAASIAETVRLFRTMLPGEQPFAHPFYWAAFLLIGDPR